MPGRGFLVECGEVRVEAVAAASGPGTAADLRTLMRRRTGLGPAADRDRFGRRAAPE
ncbi:hypothetical protein GCM10023224_27740 [Streptomonospora halophila]|uniref:Uncharacterized protein n=1 Tax=Streptomonospora halophila TaxID=427369 RepID=A0ABP9GH79_9ACTN